MEDFSNIIDVSILSDLSMDSAVDHPSDLKIEAVTTKKRSYKSIAGDCMILENGYLFCRIDDKVECKYKQKPSKLDCGNFIRHLRSEHAVLARARGLFKEDENLLQKKRRVNKVMVAIDHPTMIEAIIRLGTVEHIPLRKLNCQGFKMIFDPLCNALGMKINADKAIQHIAVCAEKIKIQIRKEVSEKLISMKIDSASRHGRHVLGINIQYWNGKDVVIRTLGKFN